jgi:xanthine/CO dehydrogenase XdhC/CoxF family maturation factor
MKELIEILTAVDTATAAGQPLALATIVGVRGSTYRRPGARLLIEPSGRMTGNISGGCLEGDVAVVAAEVVAQQSPRLVVYDLTADDDAVWGLGLGCNGAIEVFVEPTRSGDPLWRAVRASVDDSAVVVVVTVIEGSAAAPAGRRVICRPGAGAEGSLGDKALDAEAARAAEAASHDLRSRALELPGAAGRVRVFVEVLHPPFRLVVCGAGHDAIPVVQYASQLGWRVLVVDRREAFLNRERFPGAAGFVRTEFPDAGRAVPTDEHTAVLVMTHNYLHDRDLLKAFLPTPAGYLGMLGPRARTEKILREVEDGGTAIDPARRAQIYGPVGLDIGSETPDEIALAALAEILAVSRGRGAGFLRSRGGPIHTPAQDVVPAPGPAVGRTSAPAPRA